MVDYVKTSLTTSGLKKRPQIKDLNRLKCLKSKPQVSLKLPSKINLGNRGGLAPSSRPWTQPTRWEESKTNSPAKTASPDHAPASHNGQTSQRTNAQLRASRRAHPKRNKIFCKFKKEKDQWYFHTWLYL